MAWFVNNSQWIGEIVIYFSFLIFSLKSDSGKGPSAFVFVTKEPNKALISVQLTGL
jgi:hypothetical protein